MRILSEGNFMNKSKGIIFALFLITTACSKTEPNETLEVKVMEPAAVNVSGDEEMVELSLMYDEQIDIVEYLKDVISQINKMSYSIRSYIDLEKLKNGTMT